jgi:hypothetical protein
MSPVSQVESELHDFGHVAWHTPDPSGPGPGLTAVAQATAVATRSRDPPKAVLSIGVMSIGLSSHASHDPEQAPPRLRRPRRRRDGADDVHAPSPPERRAREAAKRFAELHGLAEPLVATMEECAQGSTYFVVYGHSKHSSTSRRSRSPRSAPRRSHARRSSIASARGWVARSSSSAHAPGPTRTPSASTRSSTTKATRATRGSRATRASRRTTSARRSRTSSWWRDPALSRPTRSW